jgi:hypothetical protein
MLWLVAALFFGALAAEAWQGPDTDWPIRQDIAVKRDGSLLIRSIPRRTFGWTYTDTTGRPQPAPPADELIWPVYLLGGNWTRSSWWSEADWPTRIKAFDQLEPPGIVWYLIHDGRAAGAGYFAGFDRSTNRSIGFIGETGFRNDRPPPDQQIPVDLSIMRTVSNWTPSRVVARRGERIASNPRARQRLSSLVYVVSGTRLRLVDLRERTVSTVFEYPEPIQSFGTYERAADNENDAPRQTAIVLRSAQTVLELNDHHELIQKFTLPASLRDVDMLTWHPLADGDAVAVCDLPWQTGASGNIAPRTILFVAPDGTIRRQTELTLESGMKVWSNQREAALLVAAVPVPSLLPVFEWFFGSMINHAGSVQVAVNQMVTSLWPALLGVGVLGLAFSIASWRRSRAFGLPRMHQAIWAVFVFLFGIPGYAGYRLHRRWPTRALCPRCHAQAPRDRETCAACRAPFPASEPKGIEIFA